MKYKIGDEVVITNPGKVCNTYKEWAVENNLPDFREGAVPAKNARGFIECIGLNQSYKTDMYGVITQSGGFIVEKSGLRLINRGG